MAKVVAITGATGLIGRKLRRHFATVDGIALRLFCLNPAGDSDVVTADLEHYEPQWVAAFAGVDALIHLAGESDPNADWESVRRKNIGLCMNVIDAARVHGVPRIVFASSNWVMAGYRYGRERLTPDLPPAPVNPYGHSKLFGECAGRSLAHQTGISFIALRIGWSVGPPGEEQRPPPTAAAWFQQMWIRERDLCHGMEAAIAAPDVRFAVVNLMSDNPGMRWDLAETRRILGYRPKDGHAAVTGRVGRGVLPLIRFGRHVLRRIDDCLIRRL